MRKKLVMLSGAVLLFGCLAWAGEKTWTGTVSDSHCGVKHAEPGDASAGCVKNCVKGGAKYVLVSEGKVYQLDAQDKFEGHAGHKVKVTGTLDGDAITVKSVEM